MTRFLEAHVDDTDGSVLLKDDRSHEWTVSFAGEQPTIEQVFTAGETTDEPPEDETGDEEKE